MSDSIVFKLGYDVKGMTKDLESAGKVQKAGLEKLHRQASSPSTSSRAAGDAINTIFGTSGSVMRLNALQHNLGLTQKQAIGIVAGGAAIGAIAAMAKGLDDALEKARKLHNELVELNRDQGNADYSSVGELGSRLEKVREKIAERTDPKQGIAGYMDSAVEAAINLGDLLEKGKFAEAAKMAVGIQTEGGDFQKKKDADTNGLLAQQDRLRAAIAKKAEDANRILSAQAYFDQRGAETLAIELESREKQGVAIRTGNNDLLKQVLIEEEIKKARVNEQYDAEVRQGEGEVEILKAKLGHHTQLAEYLSTELAFGEKIRRLDNGHNNELVLALKNKREEMEKAQAQAIAEKRQERNQLSLSDLAKEGSVSQRARVNRIENLERRARIVAATGAKGSLEKSQSIREQADELRRSLPNLKNSEKDLGAELTGSLDASQVLQDIRDNTANGRKMK